MERCGTAIFEHYESGIGTRAAELEALARTANRKPKPGLAHLTVEELLAEMNRNRGGVTMPRAAALHRNGQIRYALRAAGIHANSALPEHDRDCLSMASSSSPKSS